MTSKLATTYEESRDNCEQGNESEDSLTARAKRILSGNVQPSDYLVAPIEITTRVEQEISQLRSAGGFEIPTETRQWMLDNYALQYHCSGREVACWRTGNGVIVLALGATNVATILSHIPPEQRPHIVIEYP
jgi:hypothetical protein